MLIAMKRLFWIAVFAAGALLAKADLRAAPPATVVKIDIDGTINPAIDDYVEQALRHAESRRAAALVVRLNTPGGLLDSTRTIVQNFLSADVPVIVWVGPPGARAASAGMFITMAAHVAAMAPGTNIGAATPISSGGKDVENEGGQDLERKVLEDTMAFARSIAEVRGRPSDWMESAVSDAVSITSDEALQKQVIDLVAGTLDQLLQEVDGRTVKIASGSITLATAGASVETLDMRLGQQLMHYLAHPNIAYLLMLLGMLGIYFELSAPGGFIAGTLGTISLLLAFISFQVLPFRTGGLLLILLSIVLFIAEVFVPSMGILAVGGFVAFVVGSLILFNTPELDIALDTGLIAGATLAFGLCALAIGFLVLRSQRHRVVTGREAMVGETCEALTELNPNGKVFLMGEIWNAELEAGSAEKGARLEVSAVDGLRLKVRHKSSSPQPLDPH